MVSIAYKKPSLALKAPLDSNLIYYTHLVLDRCPCEAILPVDTIRRGSGEQCRPEDNCQITYGHRVLRLVLHNPARQHWSGKGSSLD
jgi:hypothetical protein